MDAAVPVALVLQYVLLIVQGGPVELMVVVGSAEHVLPLKHVA